MLSTINSRWGDEFWYAMALIAESCKMELVKLWQGFLEIEKQKQNETGKLERS